MKLNKTKIEYIIRKMNKGISGYNIAEDIKICLQRVYQIYRQYIKTGEIPILKHQGRPRKFLIQEEINIIITSFLKYRVSASILTKIIKL